MRLTNPAFPKMYPIKHWLWKKKCHQAAGVGWWGQEVSIVKPDEQNGGYMAFLTKTFSETFLADAYYEIGGILTHHYFMLH